MLSCPLWRHCNQLLGYMHIHAFIDDAITGPDCIHYVIYMMFCIDFIQEIIRFDKLYALDIWNCSYFLINSILLYFSIFLPTLCIYTDSLLSLYPNASCHLSVFGLPLWNFYIYSILLYQFHGQCLSTYGGKVLHLIAFISQIPISLNISLPWFKFAAFVLISFMTVIPVITYFCPLRSPVAM